MLCGVVIYELPLQWGAVRPGKIIHLIETRYSILKNIQFIDLLMLLTGKLYKRQRGEKINVFYPVVLL